MADSVCMRSIRGCATALIFMSKLGRRACRFSDCAEMCVIVHHHLPCYRMAWRVILPRWDMKCWRGCMYCLSQQRPSYRKNDKRITAHPVRHAIFPQFHLTLLNVVLAYLWEAAKREIDPKSILNSSTLLRFDNNSSVALIAHFFL